MLIMILKTTILFIAFLSVFQYSTQAQDTLKIDLDTFINLASEQSGLLDYEKTEVNLANNQVDQAKDLRFLPVLNAQSEHGFVPGVKSNAGLPEGAIYLDPNAVNDWDNWGLFTRVRINAAQPVFTWGAINKAVSAAREGARAAREGYNAKEASFQIQLFELYYSYVFALEIERLLDEAFSTINQIERQLNKMEEENDPDLNEADMFKFKIFKSKFQIQRVEVEQSLNFVKETWKYALRNSSSTIYEPEVRFLDPFVTDISSLDYYQESAMINRPEIESLKAGKNALELYISSLKSQNLPGLYLGSTFTFASTPIRPRQPNPFIQTPENTINAVVGFTIRQNLNFFQTKTNLERSRIELRRVDYLRNAVSDGIILEINNAYREANVVSSKVQYTREALQITKEWLRLEQLDYDFGIGDVEDLIDAMKQELELRLEEKEAIFEFNTKIAKLNKSAGLPFTYGIEN